MTHCIKKDINRINNNVKKLSDKCAEMEVPLQNAAASCVELGKAIKRLETLRDSLGVSFGSSGAGGQGHISGGSSGVELKGKG